MQMQQIRLNAIHLKILRINHDLENDDFVV